MIVQLFPEPAMSSLLIVTLRAAFVMAAINIDSLAAQGARASGTPAASSAATPRDVSTADFAWLAGSWEGKLASLPTAVAEIAFQSPRAGTITGVMRLAEGDKLLVVELIPMGDTPRGIELRFRHFNGALDAFETTFKQT